jgi:hypothetical protein
MMPTWSELTERLCEKLYPPSDKSISRQRDQALKKAHSANGALRLAQEFEASFGRTELNRLLKTFTPDEDYTPSDLHTDLLKLPWADVFTTNWDTLLERAVDAVIDRRYDVVRTRDDIPASQQPRIVKLHGSFPSNYPFIFSEEDYRSYPKKFAHFVNMAQQSMMENLFCLIGFSGDDPNFLHWTGWVRDNLGESAPKIYLVGWLELAPVQRRMLEDRNVVPVDLSRLPQGQGEGWPEECRHRYALEWFLWMLKLKRPATGKAHSSWQSQSHTPPDYLKINPDLFNIARGNRQFASNIVGPGQEERRLEALRQQILEWGFDRSGYKGWVIAPERVRRTIWRDTSIEGVSMIIHLMPPWERLFALREVVWRLEVCLAPILAELVQPVTQLLDDIDPNSRQCRWDGKEVQWIEPDWPEARKAWFEVAIALLRHYRYNRLSEQFSLLAARIEGLKGCGHSSDALTYQRLMFSLMDMDYAALSVGMQRWHVDNSDHIWAIRKAGILFEIGDFDTAHNLLADTLPAIKRSIRRDSDDFPALSREGCAMYLLEEAGWNRQFLAPEKTEEIKKLHSVNSPDGIARWKRPAMAIDSNEKPKELDSVNSPGWMTRWKTLLVNDCDIREEWKNLRATLDAEPPDPRTEKEVKERGFDLGHISTSYQTRGWQLLPAFEALLFTEAAGMPAHIFSGGGFRLILGASGLERAALWLASVDPALAIRTLMRTCDTESDKILTKVVTRERVALLDKGTAETLVEIIVHAIEQLVPEIVTDKQHIGKLRVAMELLSRLALRLTDQEKIKKVFDLAITLTHNRGISNHPWLAAPLAHLLHRTVDCFEAHAQADLILPLLELPTTGIDERCLDNEPWWDTIRQNKEQLRQIRESSLRKWTDVVCHLLNAAAISENRKRAVFRLTFLHDKEMLSEAERQMFLTALWSEEFLQTSGLPGQTDLNFWVFLILPEPEKGKVDCLIRKAYLTQPEAEKKLLNDYVNDFGSIADAARRRKIALLLTPEEASVVKSMVMKWASEKYTPSSHLFVKQQLANSEIQKFLGIAFLLPFVTMSEEEMALVQRRIGTLEEAGIPCYTLYPSLISQHPKIVENLSRRLKDGIGGDDTDFAENAMGALFFWLSLAETGHAPLPPLDIIAEVGHTIHFRHEPALAPALRFASKLFNDQPAVAETIAQNCLLGLGYLYQACEYRQAIHSGLAERVDIPLIRCNCVKLALAMSKAGYDDNTVLINWIAAAKVDPLPELRNLETRLA